MVDTPWSSWASSPALSRVMNQDSSGPSTTVIAPIAWAASIESAAITTVLASSSHPAVTRFEIAIMSRFLNSTWSTGVGTLAKHVE